MLSCSWATTWAKPTVAYSLKVAKAKALAALRGTALIERARVERARVERENRASRASRVEQVYPHSSLNFGASVLNKTLNKPMPRTAEQIRSVEF